MPKGTKHDEPTKQLSVRLPQSLIDRITERCQHVRDTTGRFVSRADVIIEAVDRWSKAPGPATSHQLAGDEVVPLRPRITESTIDKIVAAAEEAEVSRNDVVITALEWHLAN